MNTKLKDCIKEVRNSENITILELKLDYDTEKKLIELGFLGTESYIRIMHKDNCTIVTCISNENNDKNTFYLDKELYPLEGKFASPRNHLRHLQIDTINEYLNANKSEKTEEELKCPDCGIVLNNINERYMAKGLNKFIVNFEDKTIEIDYEDIIESESICYECGECGCKLPEGMVDTIEELTKLDH